MKICSRLVLGLLLLLLLACAQDQSKSSIDDKAERKAIMAVFNGLKEVSESGDIEGYMSYLSEDAVMMYSGQPAIVDNRKLQSYLTDFFKNFEFELNRWQSDEIQISGDLAFHRYSGIATITPKDGGESSILDRKYIDILRKEAGAWKVSHHIYNTNK